MPRKTKYRQGRRILTIQALVRELQAGRYVYWYHKPLHPGWVRSMQLQSVLYGFQHNAWRYAKENPDA